MDHKEKKTIKEAIVVEGRDDEAAVLSAVDARIICTHGYGIRKSTLEAIGAAYRETGIIIFTDPDHAGSRIRERLTKLFPDAKQAHLTKSEAEKDGDIGIENAAAEDIVKALKVASAETREPVKAISEEDMICLGLAGRTDSKARREAVGSVLGIGYGNAKAFAKRLSYMNISVEQICDALRQAGF